MDILTFLGMILILSLSIVYAARPEGGELAKEGSRAPAFEGITTDGSTIKLEQYNGKSIVVLYFYPKDDTPGCTKQACGFRDAMEDLKRKDVVILGVSTDDADSHRAFTEKYKLNFPLLVDSNQEIAKAYGVPVTFGVAKRVTFLIGMDGIIKKVYASVDVSNHARDILQEVEKMGGSED